jgi:hypothetical protein
VTDRTRDDTKAAVKGAHIDILVARSRQKPREQIAGWLAAR